MGAYLISLKMSLLALDFWSLGKVLSQSPSESSLDSVSVRLHGGQNPDQLDGAES